MSYLTLFITVPLTVFITLFAISNTGDISVSLWPLDQTFTIGIWLLGLGMMAAGFALGALFVSILSQKTRFRYWQERRRADKLEQELERVHKTATTSISTDAPR